MDSILSNSTLKQILMAVVVLNFRLQWILFVYRGAKRRNSNKGIGNKDLPKCVDGGEKLVLCRLCKALDCIEDIWQSARSNIDTQVGQRVKRALAVEAIEVKS